MIRTEHAALLDLDGTLVDSLHVYYNVVNHILSKFGVSSTYEELFARAGQSSVELYTHFLKKNGKYDPSMEKELHDMYSVYVSEELKGISLPKESIYTISALKDRGYMVAICTGAERSFVEDVIPKDVLGIIDSVVTCDDVTFGKPDPETFLIASDEIGISPFNCFVVGDSINDLLGANNAGMRFILMRNMYNTAINEGYVREINNITELIS
jgi:HAD superfamily hydrolase (TIGR01509 family)